MAGANSCPSAPRWVCSSGLTFFCISSNKTCATAHNDPLRVSLGANTISEYHKQVEWTSDLVKAISDSIGVKLSISDESLVVFI